MVERDLIRKEKLEVEKKKQKNRELKDLKYESVPEITSIGTLNDYFDTLQYKSKSNTGKITLLKDCITKIEREMLKISKEENKNLQIHQAEDI